VGDAFQLFNNLADTGIGATYRGEYLLAQEHFAEAAATARAAVDLAGDADARRRMQACEAQGLILLAQLAAVQADYASARLHAEAALTLARTVAEQWLIARALSTLGEILLGQGDLATARRLLEESLSIHLLVSERGVRAYALDHLARVALAQELYREAQAQFVESLTLRQEAGDVAKIARSLEGMAAMAAGRAQPERAVRLVGAADAMRETVGAPLHPQDRAWRDCWLEPLRSVFDNETVTRAWTSGHVLSMEQAVAVALNETEAALTASNQPDKVTATPAAPLSAREQEVASLLALGLTNRQIAERLVITERTVAAHIEHILNKLDFVSRTQIGVWAAEHGLVVSSIA
jgi:non-specific serine/threonine protein kinase